MNDYTVRALIAATIALSACGGGGGSDGSASGGGGSGTPPPTSSSGLIPTASTAGAQLVADVATLRPLRAGAVWTYHGSMTARTGATPTGYTTQTTQQAQAVGVIETGSNVDNAGPDSVGIAVGGGAITSTQTINLTGTPETVVSTELRSPVRINDQYTLLDRHYDNCNCDVDQDGKADALDIGVYSVVVGQQTVTFDNLPPLTAVEVDTFIRLRYKLSGSGLFTSVGQATQKVWYAAGIGVVRRSTIEPADSNGDVTVTVEQLAAWDGLTEGLGALPASSLSVPATSPVLPGATLRSLLGQFAFNDHGLLVTGLTTDAYTGGAVISTIDLRGHVTAAQSYPGLPHDPQMLMTSNDVGLFHVEPSFSGPPTLSMTRFDTAGILVGSIGGTTIDLSGGRASASLSQVRIAGEGSTVWVLWNRFFRPTPTSSQMTEIVLRGFGPDGTPNTPEILLDGPVFANGSQVVDLSARSGRAIALWTSTVVSVGNSYRYAAVTDGATAATPHELVGGVFSPNLFPVPSLLDSGGAITWSSPFFGNGSLLNLAGVRLDATFAAQRTTTGSIDGELLAGVPRFPLRAETSGQRLILTGQATGLLWPEDMNAQGLTTINLLDGAAPLAATSAKQFRLPGQATAQLVFSDRIILLGGTTITGTSTVVWLR